MQLMQESTDQSEVTKVLSVRATFEDFESSP
jgi:hypothetical protein